MEYIRSGFEQVVWLCIYGIPTDAWNAEFFMLLANSLESFISIYKNTVNDITLEVSRIQVKMDFFSNVRERAEVNIDGKYFLLVIKEDGSAQFRHSIDMTRSQITVLESSDSVDSGDVWSEDFSFHGASEKKWRISG